MMNKNSNVTEKGFYSHPQKTVSVQLKQYIITKDGDKRCLMLRFVNNSELIIDGMNIILTEIRKDAQEPKHTRLSIKELKVYPGDTFSLKNGIAISDDCIDFKVEITSVISKDYEYFESNGTLTPKYDPRFKVGKRKGKTAKLLIKRRRVSASIASAVVAIIGVTVFLFIARGISDRAFGNFAATILPYIGRF